MGQARGRRGQSRARRRGRGRHRRDARAHRRAARARAHRRAVRHRRAGEGAEAAAGPPLRSAGDRAAHGRGSSARRPCGHRGRRGRRDRRGAGTRLRRRPTRRRSSLSASVSAGPRRDGAAQAVSGRGRGIRRPARRRADGGAARRSIPASSFRGRRRPRHGRRKGCRARSIPPISRSSGSSSIPRKLPLIFRRIRETADAVIAAQPDALIIIDSPDFTHRVARRVRKSRAADSDHQLRAADGVGLAAGARARDARLCRRGAGDPAVRAGGVRAA